MIIGDNPMKARKSIKLLGLSSLCRSSTKACPQYTCETGAAKFSGTAPQSGAATKERNLDHILVEEMRCEKWMENWNDTWSLCVIQECLLIHNVIAPWLKEYTMDYYMLPWNWLVFFELVLFECRSISRIPNWCLKEQVFLSFFFTLIQLFVELQMPERISLNNFCVNFFGAKDLASANVELFKHFFSFTFRCKECGGWTVFLLLLFSLIFS